MSQGIVERLKVWARALKRDVLALYRSARDPRVPWYAKAVAGLVAAYALSPIDLIPDFVPVLGYLDDLIIVPIGIFLSGGIEILQQPCIDLDPKPAGDRSFRFRVPMR